MTRKQKYSNSENYCCRKYTPVLFLISLIFPMIISAGSFQTAKMKPDSGSSALEFQINGLLNISSYQGGTISYKKKFKNNNALRLGLTFDKYNNYSENDYLTEIQYSDIDTSVISLSFSSYDYKRINLAVYTQYLSIIRQEKYSTFLGIGLITGINVYYQDQDYVRNPQPFIVSNDRFNLPRVSTRLPFSNVTYNSYFLGLLLSAGFEWFYRPNISLTAEYNSRIQYGHYFDGDGYDGDGYMVIRKNRIDNYQGTYDYSMTTIASGYYYSVIPSVKLGMSIYFNRTH